MLEIAAASLRMALGEAEESDEEEEEEESQLITAVSGNRRQ